MALETLKDIDEIGGFKVAHMEEIGKTHPEMVEESGQLNWEYFEEHIRPNYPITIRHGKNSITFNIQNGPIKEFGENGCQVDTMITAARLMVYKLNKNFPCKENEDCLGYLDAALESLMHRRERREREGNEGYNRESTDAISR